MQETIGSRPVSGKGQSQKKNKGFPRSSSPCVALMTDSFLNNVAHPPNILESIFWMMGGLPATCA